MTKVSKRLKGDLRFNLNDVDTRKEQLLLIPYVDEVVIFDNDTPPTYKRNTTQI